MIGEASMARRPGIPAHDRYVFADKAHKYAIAVFCINEGDRIRAQLARMAPLAAKADIVVADGGSSDGSLDRDTLAGFKLRALLVKKDVGKLSAQMRMAMAYAIEEGYQGLVVIDGNGKDDVTAVPRFLELLDEGYDHIQGSRYISGGKGVNTPLARHVGVKLVHAPLVSVAARRRYTDTTNGFRAYSRKLLTDMRVSPLRDIFLGYELHYYLAIRAARLGFRVVETPVTREYPREGKVPTKISGFRGNFAVLKTLASVVRGEFDPDRRPPADERNTGEWST
jgi:dolichol-phosphate mannosyltransferase